MRITAVKKVEKLLYEHPATRNSDKALFVYFMQEAGMGLSREQIDVFRKMPSMESIRRIRQKLQEQGKYPATEGIRRERSHKSMVMQQTMPTAGPEQVDTVINQAFLPWGSDGE